MTELPPFHNFREAAECLARGGAVYRYPSMYPLWCNKGIEKRFEYYYYPQYRSANIGYVQESNYKSFLPQPFTREEQEAKDWILMEKEEFDAFEKKRIADQEESERKWREYCSSQRSKISVANTPLETESTTISYKKPGLIAKFWSWISD